MTFIQKKSDKKILLFLLILTTVLVLGGLAYNQLSIGPDNSVQPSVMEAPVTFVTALEPGNSAGTITLGDLLRVCPSEEIINKMPTLTPSQNPPSIYFILEGERRELTEFDLQWVAANCDVGEQAVY